MILTDSVKLVNDIDGLVASEKLLSGSTNRHWRTFFEACREEHERECRGSITDFSWEGICHKAVRTIDLAFLRKKAGYRLSLLATASDSELFAFRLVAHEDFASYLEKNLYISGTSEDVLQFFESPDNIK